jgi:hypothetical protein
VSHRCLANSALLINITLFFTVLLLHLGQCPNLGQGISGTPQPPVIISVVFSLATAAEAPFGSFFTCSTDITTVAMRRTAVTAEWSMVCIVLNKWIMIVPLQDLGIFLTFPFLHLASNCRTINSQKYGLEPGVVALACTPSYIRRQRSGGSQFKACLGKKFKRPSHLNQ